MKDQKFASSVTWIIIITGATSIIFLISFSVNFWALNCQVNPEQWGQTEDYFGGVLNPIFSGANLIVTILIARELQCTVRSYSKVILSQE
jgi:hypothetical protein